VITPTNWLPLITLANTTIRQAWSEIPVEYPKIATTVTMGDKSVFEDAWIGRMPKMRLWSGPRVYNQPGPVTYTVVPEPFEDTYTLDRFRYDDDSFGVFYPLLLDLAEQTKKWPDYQIRDLIESTGAWTSTTSQAGLDGLSFWNTAHPTNLYSTQALSLSTGTSYCNDFTGGGQTINSVNVGGALSQTSLLSIIEYSQTVRAEDGERLMITPSALMVPPTLQSQAAQYLENGLAASSVGPTTWGAAQTQVGATDNVVRRYGLELYVNRMLASATKFYVLDNTKSVKPFRWILREPPAITPRVAESDPIVFDSHMYAWGAWARGAPAWSPSWLAYRSGP
jgi:phage major head subunit gpT-like protein